MDDLSPNRAVRAQSIVSNRFSKTALYAGTAILLAGVPALADNKEEKAAAEIVTVTDAGADAAADSDGASAAGVAVSMADLETIAVYATRDERPSFDYAGQVTVVDRNQILDFNPQTLQDVFQAIPGARFDSGPRRSGDAPTIRGIGANGTLIFLDGARQSFLSGHDGRFFVDPELVQAVEVVRGPTSALYGSGALGGVIAATTVSADDLLDEGESVYARLSGGFQSVNDEYRVGLTGAWRSTDGRFDVVGHVTYRDSSSIALGSGDTLPADDEIVSSLLKTTFRPSEDVELYASWMRFGLEATDPQNPQGVNVAGPGNALVFRDSQNNTVQGGLRWNPADNDLLDLNIVGYYSDNAVEEDDVESPRTVDRTLETIGISIDNRSRFTLNDVASLTFVYGGEYYRDRQRGLDSNTVDGTRGGVPDAETEFWGAFVSADLALEGGALLGVLTLSPGVRFDSFDSTAEDESFGVNEDQVTFKIGATYKPIPELMFYGNFAQGFRAPNINEAFADGVHFNIPNLTAPPGPRGPQFVSNLFIGNPDLQSEESDTYEFGIGLDLDSLLSEGDSFLIKGGYYRSEVDNLIGLDVNTPLGCFSPMFAGMMPCGTGAAFGNTSQNINIRNAVIDGFELEFTYQSDFVYMRGNYATMNGVDDDTGEFLEGVLQPDTFFLDSGLIFEEIGLRVGNRLTIAGSFNDVNDPEEARDNFVVNDVYLVWTPKIEALEGIRLDLGIDNVGNEDYEVVFAGVSQPGRNYKVGLSWTQGF